MARSNRSLTDEAAYLQTDHDEKPGDHRGIPA
jgi:hypothetical protein